MTEEMKALTLSHDLPPGLPEGYHLDSLMEFFLCLNSAFHYGYDPEADYRNPPFPHVPFPLDLG
jgi:hypothetical protein